jgi:hypothetical protein
VLFRAGVRSKCLIPFQFLFTTYSTVGRCTAPADNLDAESGRRSHIHTDALIEQYSHRMLWEDYGIVGEVIVSHILLFVP